MPSNSLFELWYFRLGPPIKDRNGEFILSGRSESKGILSDEQAWYFPYIQRPSSKTNTCCSLCIQWFEHSFCSRNLSGYIQYNYDNQRHQKQYPTYESNKEAWCSLSYRRTRKCKKPHITSHRIREPNACKWDN